MKNGFPPVFFSTSAASCPPSERPRLSPMSSVTCERSSAVSSMGSISTPLFRSSSTARMKGCAELTSLSR